MAARQFVNESGSWGGLPTDLGRDAQSLLNEQVVRRPKASGFGESSRQDLLRGRGSWRQGNDDFQPDDSSAVELVEETQAESDLGSSLTARDLMTASVVTARPEDSIERSARRMGESGCGALPVIDGSGRLLGMITERDITVRLVARGQSVPHAQVSDCMTSETFACSADSSIESCARAMAWHQVRRMPIVDDDHRLIGIVSQGDLARYVSEHPERAGGHALANTLWAFAY